MAAPKFAPVPPVDDARSYSSPDYVPRMWMPDRPAEIIGFQPQGTRLGYQGPDQGFGIKIANTFRPKLQLQTGESADDAVTGCLGIALKRASLFSRAPVVHDFTVAFTVWGFLDASPPADLLALRRELFQGMHHHGHGYHAQRHVADMVPDSTLRMTPQQAAAAYPGRWRDLVGADHAAH
ncbi:MAG: hypothetical protein U0Q03_11025 [Acidimicrobiales bacterium]